MLTGAVSAGKFSNAFPAWILSGILVIVVVVLFFLLVSVVLFIISIFKKKVPFEETATKVWDIFGKNYRSFYKYYLPLLFYILYERLLEGYDFFLQFTGDKSYFETASLSSRLVLLLPFLIVLIYLGIVNLSLAKSSFPVLEGKKFTFQWASLREVVVFFCALLLYGLLLLLGLPFLMIPTLLLGYASFFVRYSVIVEHTGIFGTIKNTFLLLRNHFWDLVFYSSMFSAALSAGSAFIKLPLIGDVVWLLVYATIFPFGIMWLAEVYQQLRKQEGLPRKK